MKYCIYCRIDEDKSVFIGDDYRTYLCAKHKDKPEFKHDARDLDHIDDGIDLDKEWDEIKREQVEEHAREFLSAYKSARRPFGDGKAKYRVKHWRD